MEEFNQLFDDSLLNVDQKDDKTVKLKAGERRMVSILFADIKGFTSLSEKLDHEEVQTLLDQLMKIFSHCVEIHCGYVDKYTGDQIMALFGAKKASEVDTQRAINTSMLILKKLSQFNTILKKSEKYGSLDVDLSVRIGINTGMVTTGAVGKERAGDYTVYGDAVNLASRMESNAPINTIMVPENTMVLVSDNFIFKDYGTIEVKGKKEPISVYLVDSKKDLVSNPSSPFIGREEEIKLLKKNYIESKNNIDKCLYKKVNFVGVTADAGVGKSRLINEFIKSLTNCNFSLSHASNISSKPYYIFTRLIKDLFQISQLDSLDKTKVKFEQTFKSLINLNPNIKTQLNDSKTFIGFLLGLSFNDTRLKDRSELQNHINSSIKYLIKAAASKANNLNEPYILILDDLHWIDKMSLKTLEYLVNTINLESERYGHQYSQILILSTYRTEHTFNSNLKNDLNFTQIHLKPLKEKDSIKLINLKAGKLKINKKTAIDLIDKSKGNPFFIEEWLILLKEKYKHAETIDESRGIKNVYEIPKSINALILSRIDNLEKTLKLLLQKATIIGEDFFIQILSHLEDKLGVDNNIERPVNHLENEDFIHHYINQLDRYKFKHMLTRDVAYSTVLISNKVILHKAVAEIIEEHFADKLNTFYFDLAIHYDISKEFDKALKYLYLAGLKHKALFDFKHAGQCFNRIITIISNESKYDSKDSLSTDNYKHLINSQIQLINIYINIGKWNETEKLILNLRSIKIKDEKMHCLFLQEGAVYYSLNRKFDISADFLNQALKIAKSIDNKSYIAKITGLLADNMYDTGNLQSALDEFKNELKLFILIKDDLAIGNAYSHLGKTYLGLGDLKLSFKHFNLMYDIAKKYDSKQMQLHALGNISLIHNIRGEYKKSIKLYKEVMETAEDIYDLRSQAQTYGNLGIIYKNLDEYNLALSNNKKQLRIAQKLNDKLQIANAFSNFGIVNQKIGNFKDSIDYHEKNISLQKDIDDNIGIARSFTNLSITYFDQGKLDKAKKYLSKGLKIFTKYGDKRSENLGNFELSKFLQFEENYNQGITSIQLAIDFFEEQNDTVLLIRSYNRIARLYRLNNDTKSAIVYLNKSLKLLKKLQNQKLAERTLIEHKLCTLDKSNSITYLEKFISETTDINLKAYIHFSLFINLKENKKNNKSSAIKYYKEQFKKVNRFEYKYYLDLLN